MDCSFSPSSESLESKTARTVYHVSLSGMIEIFDANRNSLYVSSFTWNQQGSLLLATCYCEDELHVSHTLELLHYKVFEQHFDSLKLVPASFVLQQVGFANSPLFRTVVYSPSLHPSHHQ